MSSRSSRLLVAAAWCSTMFLSPAPGLAQHGAANGEWRSYGGDLGSTKNSALDRHSVIGGNGDPLRAVSPLVVSWYRRIFGTIGNDWNAAFEDFDRTREVIVP